MEKIPKPRQPAVMPTFVMAGDERGDVGYEVMYMGSDNMALVEDLDGKLYPIELELEDLVIPQ